MDLNENNLKNHGREEIAHQKPGHSENEKEVKESQDKNEIVDN